jgi:hypothetical protein
MVAKAALEDDGTLQRIRTSRSTRLAREQFIRD